MEQMYSDINELMENETLWNKQSILCQRFAGNNFNIQDAVSKLEGLTYARN
jgi:hypothetical protein